MGGWHEKKELLIVTSLLLVKCSVTKGISFDKFFPMLTKNWLNSLQIPS